MGVFDSRAFSILFSFLIFGNLLMVAVDAKEIRKLAMPVKFERNKNPCDNSLFPSLSLSMNIKVSESASPPFPPPTNLFEASPSLPPPFVSRPSCAECVHGFIPSQNSYCDCVAAFPLKLRFLELEFANFNFVVRDNLINQIAKNLEINSSQIQIVSVTQGSVILDMLIFPFQATKFTYTKTQSIINRIQSHNLTLSPTTQNYEILTLGNSSYAANSSSSSNSNSNLDSNSKSPFYARRVFRLGLAVGGGIAIVIFLLVALFAIRYKKLKSSAKFSPEIANPESNQDGVREGEVVSEKLENNENESSCNSNSTPKVVRTHKTSKHRNLASDALRFLGSKKKWALQPPKSNHGQSQIEPVTYKDILNSTCDLKNKNFVSESIFSRTYKGESQKLGKVLAIEVRGENVPEDEFVGRISALSELKNPYLIPILAYCMDANHRFVLYKNIDKSSLYDHLHGELQCSRQLNWFRRVLISVDLADILSYLHESIMPCIIHKDIQPPNVILDNDFRALLIGTGVSTLVKDTISEHDVGAIKPSPYLAPEVRFRKVQNTQSDVFGLGIILMELFTGRKAYDDNRPKGQKSLMAWVVPHVGNKHAMQMLVDPYLRFDSYFDLDIGQLFIQLASDCVKLIPSERPKMSDVKRRLRKMLPEISERNGSTNGPALAEIKWKTGYTGEMYEYSDATSEVESIATRNTTDTASSKTSHRSSN